jgi:DNA-binding GntR family transcriptional regulator
MINLSEPKGGTAAPIPLHIDRKSDTPVYSQLAEILHQQILTGVYHPGEKLPSEGELVELYDVSPMTVRRAINLLAAQNIIETSHRRGTFVKAVDLRGATFSLDDLVRIFEKPGTRVKMLEARFLPADERIARKLKIKSGTRTIFIRRLLSLDDRPTLYHRAFLIFDLTRPVVEAEYQVTELMGLFRGSGNTLIKSGELSLESTMLSDEEREILQVQGPSSGMLLEHVFSDFQNKPVSWGWFVCHSSQLRLQTLVGLEYTSGGKDERAR